MFVGNRAQYLDDDDEEVSNDDKLHKWGCPALHWVALGSICDAYVSDGDHLKKQSS